MTVVLVSVHRKIKININTAKQGHENEGTSYAHSTMLWTNALMLHKNFIFLNLNEWMGLGILYGNT